MSYKNAYGAQGVLTQSSPADASSTIIQLDSPLSGQIRSVLGVGDWTYLQLGSGPNAEVVKLNYSATNNYTVVRGQSGTAAKAHSIGTIAAFVVVPEAVAPLVTPNPTLYTGSGIVDITDYVVDVPEPEFTGQGIQISGTYPDLEFTLTADDTGCCGNGSSGSSGLVAVYGDGIAQVSQSGGSATVTVVEPNFTGTGLSIYGTWPNISFNVDASGVGTVTSVASGAGITITGSPTTTPTVNLTPTGVTAGTYGGLVVNAYGQLTSADPTFNPPSTFTAATPLSTTRTGGTQALSIASSAEGVVGAVALADADDPLDGTDRTTAVTPALLSSVIDALDGASVSGDAAFNGETASSYTTVITAVPLAIDLAAGQKMLVQAQATMVDTGTPGTPVQFGIAVFNSSSVLLQASRSITQSQQSMSFILTGPMNTGLVLSTTEAPSGAAIVGSGLTAIKF